MNLAHSELSAALGSTFAPEPARHDYRAFSASRRSSPPALTAEMFAFWHARATAVRDATGAGQSFVLQHVPSQMVEQGLARGGGNPLNIPVETQTWWTTTADWATAEHDDLVRSVAIDTVDRWRQRISQLADAEAGDGDESDDEAEPNPYLFMNDASRDQNPCASYGEDSLRRLRRIARAYDPNQVFQRLQGGGFKLSQA